MSCMRTHSAQGQICLPASLLPERPWMQQDACLHDKADTLYKVLQSQTGLVLRLLTHHSLLLWSRDLPKIGHRVDAPWDFRGP